MHFHWTSFFAQCLLKLTPKAAISFYKITLLSLSCLLAAEELEGAAETLSGDEELPVAAEPHFQLPSASTEVPLLPLQLAGIGTFDLLRFMAALMYAAELESCGCICWAGEPWWAFPDGPWIREEAF